MWGPLIEWLQTEVMGRGLFDIQEMHNIFQITSAEKVVHFIKKVHEDRSGEEHVCVNYSKYRVEFK
jgi:hypothetical protein